MLPEADTVDPDLGACRIGLLSQVGGNPIDRDPPRLDKSLRGSSGCKTRTGDQLVNPFDDPSGRNGRSSVSTTSAGGTWSASGGSSPIELTPSFSSIRSVVPYNKACPGPGAWPIS